MRREEGGGGGGGEEGEIKNRRRREEGDNEKNYRPTRNSAKELMALQLSIIKIFPLQVAPKQVNATQV